MNAVQIGCGVLQGALFPTCSHGPRLRSQTRVLKLDSDSEENIPALTKNNPLMFENLLHIIYVTASTRIGIWRRHL